MTGNATPYRRRCMAGASATRPAASTMIAFTALPTTCWTRRSGSAVDEAMVPGCWVNKGNRHQAAAFAARMRLHPSKHVRCTVRDGEGD